MAKSGESPDLMGVRMDIVGFKLCTNREMLFKLENDYCLSLKMVLDYSVSQFSWGTV